MVPNNKKMGGSKAQMLKTEPFALTKSTRHSNAKSTILTSAEVAKGFLEYRKR